ALVFAAAYLDEWIGLVGIIGAFFAGIILTRYIPAVSPLMNRIEFVGNALFIPYFLIGVGMMINLRGFTSWYSIWVAMVMIVVAILSKWIAAWVMQKHFGLSQRSRNMIFGLSSAKAAATLAAVLIGYKVGLFDAAIFNGAILMILVTCTVSAFVTEEAAKEIALGAMSGEGGASVPDDAEKILIPISNPLTTDLLVNLALIMKNPRLKVPLCLLNVINDARQDNPSARKISENTLLHASKIVTAADTPVETISRYDMNVAAGIIHTIKEKGISEVLLGLHYKANIADTFLGIKAETLLKGSSKMVLIAKMQIPANTITRIVLVVPEKAEYETGFAKWVNRIANMASQLGCRVIFYGQSATLMQIKGRLLEANSNIRAEFQIMDKWGDILMLTGVVLDDDLFVIVSSRPASVSYNPDFEKLPSFLSRYFSGNNIVVLYPEQFGEEGELTFFSDPLAINVRQNHEFITHIRNYLRSFFSRGFFLKKRNKKTI
ncbi:MAG: cation:proton antiporter, partial [Bacteroidales bacterium]